MTTNPACAAHSEHDGAHRMTPTPEARMPETRTMDETVTHFDVTPTYERPATATIIVGDAIRVAAESEDAARDFIAAHLIAARLTPVRIDVTPAAR